MGTGGKERKLVKFAPKGNPSFYDTVKERVGLYFETTGLSPNGNRQMYVKTIAMLSLYLVPFFLVIAGVGRFSLPLFYGCWLVMGFGIVGIGTGVMHDSNHSSYSTNKRVNMFLGGLLNFIGGYSVNWRIQHNILHHTYTNLAGLDDDLNSGTLLRMSPHQPHRAIQRWQHIYCWPLYCIMNLYWVFAKDYKQIFEYDKQGLLKKEKKTLRQAFWELTVLRVLYFSYILALPILVSGTPWQHIVGGFLLMHVFGGLALACIFQPAHVMETSDFAPPDDNCRLENNWAVHQVLNTANFAPYNRPLTWYLGGLNRQIEHHLFPQVCHVHYAAIAKIVKEAAAEYGLPYYEYPTYRSALIGHYKMLKMLGRDINREKAWSLNRPLIINPPQDKKKAERRALIEEEMVHD